MELKSRKNLLCLIVVGLLDLRVCGQLDVTGTEMRGVFGDLQVSHFLQSEEEEGQLSVSVSVCLSLSVGVLSLLVSSAFF